MPLEFAAHPTTQEHTNRESRAHLSPRPFQQLQLHQGSAIAFSSFLAPPLPNHHRYPSLPHHLTQIDCPIAPLDYRLMTSSLPHRCRRLTTPSSPTRTARSPRSECGPSLVQSYSLLVSVGLFSGRTGSRHARLLQRAWRGPAGPSGVHPDLQHPGVSLLRSAVGVHIAAWFKIE